MPVVALLLSLLLGTAALVMLLRSSPARLLRPYRDPRLVTRVEALARELASRGWMPMPAHPEDPATIRRLARSESLELAIGCAPGSDWCRVEATLACGLGDDEAIAQLWFDRDGIAHETADVPQEGSPGFVVRPREALQRLPARLLAALAVWPPRWTLGIRGAHASVHAKVSSADEIEAVVATVLWRLGA